MSAVALEMPPSTQQTFDVIGYAAFSVIMLVGVIVPVTAYTRATNIEVHTVYVYIPPYFILFYAQQNTCIHTLHLILVIV